MLKYYKYLIFLWWLLTFISCATTKVIDTNRSFTEVVYPIDSTIMNDRGMNIMVSSYKFRLDSLMNQAIGISEHPLTKAQPDCTLGHLVTDALLETAKEKDPLVQVAISNQGGIRINYLSPGTITLGNIYEVMPFDNMLVVLEVPGEIMMLWCQHIANKGGWPVSNISFEISDNKAQNIVVNGKPINEKIVYRVATSDYIANGGDDCSFLKNCKRYTYNVLMRNAMIQYIRNHTADGTPLSITLENRIKYAE